MRLACKGSSKINDSIVLNDIKRIAVVDLSVFIGSTPPPPHHHVLGVASQEHELVALLLVCSLFVYQVMIFKMLISLTTNVNRCPGICLINGRRPRIKEKWERLASQSKFLQAF